MPTAPLFDLSQIDLTQTRLSREQVGEMNPQAGDMRHLDHVIWMSDDFKCGLGVKAVRADEFWVPGHIPGRPLLPGVIMIEAGAQMASILYRSRSSEKKFLGFTRCDEVVFRQSVVPGDTLYLLAEEVSFKPRRFISRTQGIVNGQIAFEATITGMVMPDEDER